MAGAHHTGAAGACDRLRLPDRRKAHLHGAVKCFHATGSRSGIRARYPERFSTQSTALDTAAAIDDMDSPGFRRYTPKRTDSGRGSIRKHGNRHITFAFRDGHAPVPDDEDFH